MAANEYVATKYYLMFGSASQKGFSSAFEINSTGKIAAYVILAFVAFAFIFKISLSTPGILALLAMGFHKRSRHNNILHTKLGAAFFSIYAIYLFSFWLIEEETSRTLIRSLGMIFIPLLFMLRKFTLNEINVFAFSFLIFQIAHMIYADALMFDGIFIKHFDFDRLTTMVEQKFIIERPYLSLNCLLAMMCLKFLHNKQLIRFTVLLALMLFFVLSLYLIAARLALGISLILTAITLFKNRIKPKFTLIITGIIGFTILAFGRYTIDRFFLKRGEPRIVIWSCARGIVENGDFNFFFGEFSGDRLNRKLQECYASDEVHSGLYWWISEHHYIYNTHNEFLNFFVGYGFFGLLCFLLVFVLQVRNYFVHKDFFALLFVIVFMAQCFFENILSRQLGIYLFAWFAFIFVSSGPTDTEKHAD